MNFILTPPSLQHRVFVKIAITLWNSCNVKCTVPKLYGSLENEWHEEVAEKVSKLPLPPLLNEELLHITEQTGLRMLSWMKLLDRYAFSFATEGHYTIIWTPNGTIDQKKTAEMLAKDETIDVEKRFSLACAYCLEDDILNLRENLEPTLNINNPNRTDNHFLILFWRNYLKEHEEFYFTRTMDNLTAYEYLFKFATLVARNEVAIQYFSPKLRPQHAEELKMVVSKYIANSLQRENIYCYADVRSSDILFFLLSTMNVEQQAKIFQSCTYGVLACLLLWPRQDMILDIEKDKWNFLSKEGFERLLHDIVRRMSCKYSYFKKVFLDFWKQAPQTYKQFVTDGAGFGRLLLELYQKKSERNVQVILKDSSVSARKNLIFSCVGQDICEFLVYHEMWDSIKYLIPECISSSEDMSEFKDQIINAAPTKSLNSTVLSSRNKVPEEQQWNKLLQMVEDFILHKKRKCMEDNNA